MIELQTVLTVFRLSVKIWICLLFVCNDKNLSKNSLEFHCTTHHKSHGKKKIHPKHKFHTISGFSAPAPRCPDEEISYSSSRLPGPGQQGKLEKMCWKPIHYGNLGSGNSIWTGNTGISQFPQPGLSRNRGFTLVIWEKSTLNKNIHYMYLHYSIQCRDLSFPLSPGKSEVSFDQLYYSAFELWWMKFSI